MVILRCRIAVGLAAALAVPMAALARIGDTSAPSPPFGTDAGSAVTFQPADLGDFERAFGAVAHQAGVTIVCEGFPHTSAPPNGARR